jgi:hypothetical protein
MPNRSRERLEEPASHGRCILTGRVARLGAGASLVVLFVMPIAKPAAAMGQHPGIADTAEVNVRSGRASAQPRTFVVSTLADLIRAGGTSGLSTGGGLFVGLLTGPLAGVPVAGPLLADQFTKGWSQSQGAAGDGARALADAVAQAGTPLAPVLNPVGAPIISGSDSVSESGVAAEELLAKVGMQTNLVSAPLKFGAQLAHAMN